MRRRGGERKAGRAATGRGIVPAVIVVGLSDDGPPGALLAPADGASGAHTTSMRRRREAGQRSSRMAKHAYETERWVVLREYDSWARKNPDLANKRDPMLFFSYLQSERSDLLDFKSRGVDKWQIVHGWLLSSGRVKKT